MASRLVRAALVAALALGAWPPRPASACSVCLAGDPLYSKDGTTAQRQGDFSLYLQAQGLRKEAGLLPHGDEDPHDDDHDEGDGFERAVGRRLDLFLSWTPIDRATLTLGIPYAWNEIEEHEHDGSQTFRLDGLGDVSLAATVVPWRNRDVLPSTWVETRLFVKLPTGRHQRRDGGVVDPHLQTGTGSWDFGVGVAAVHRLAWGSLFTSLFYRENTEADFGDLDYEYGDVVLWNAALEVPLGHALGVPWLDRLTLGSELNFRWAESDRVDDARFGDSGGSVLYGTPSLRVRLPFSVRERPTSLRVAVQLPVTSSWLHGDQDEKEVWSVGLLVPF